MVPKHTGRNCRQFAGWAIALCLTGLPALAETPVARGDVLFVSVAGAPELTRDARVDVDGRIRLPLVGGISVAGLTIDAIQERVAQSLISHDILLDPIVLIEVSQYRPVYVGGQVKTSGEVTYQPGLTVRQAIISAGGLFAGEAETATGLGEILELLAQQRAGEQALRALDSEITRLNAQLAEEAIIPEAPAKTGADADPAPVRDIDAALLDDVLTEQAADRAYADTALALTDVELEVLSQLAAHQSDEQALQRAEVEAMRTLVERGLAPRSRLQELEREESRLARDLLENQTFAARARQNRETIRHQTQADLTAQRITTREALRRAVGERSVQVAQLQALQGHLLAAGRIPEDPSVALAAPVLRIFRTDALGAQTLPATMETEIYPGDVVDVSLPLTAPRG